MKIENSIDELVDKMTILAIEPEIFREEVKKANGEKGIRHSDM